MLYTNEALEITNKEMKFGSVMGTSIGEEGRGRREVFLPTPAGMEGEITKGLHTDLTIGTSKSGRPRINKRKDDTIYLILSSARGYTRRGDGYIETLFGFNRKDDIVARANGADGDAGRIGTWDAMVLRAKEGSVFKVTWSGYGYGYADTFYVVHEGKVYEADLNEIEDLCDQLGIDVPFTLRWDGTEYTLEGDEWNPI